MININSNIFNKAIYENNFMPTSALYFRNIGKTLYAIDSMRDKRWEKKER